MNPTDYQQAAHRSASPKNDNDTHYALGICTEAGEIAHEIKAHEVYGKPIDRESLVLELGDLAWYMTNLMRLHGITWTEVFVANVKKLAKRYAEGFSKKAAIDRLDVVEQMALSQKEGKA